VAIYNPGEPVWNPTTGDIVDDPDTGDALIVVGTDTGESAAYWPDPVTGTVYQRDDVTNAVWYRVNTRKGEVLRDKTIGINYDTFVFGGSVSRDLINAEVSAAVRTVPGVAAMIGGRFVSFNVQARSVVFLFTVRKKSGSVTQGVVAA
jgi:hypothetical protein